jgi:hypothetical protein
VLTGTTDADGIFDLPLTTAHTAPCMLQVAGGTPSVTLHGFATAAGLVNITPITDLIVAKALGSDPATAFSAFDRTTGSTISGALTTAKAYVQTQVTSITGSGTTADPMSGKFVVGDADDKVLDALGAALAAASGNKTIVDLRSSATRGEALTGIVPAYLGAPVGATATVNSATQITVNWNRVPGAAGYNVYRSTAASVQVIPANKITATAVSAVGGYVDNGLSASTAYYYKVTAVNTVAPESAPSAEATATTSAASTGGGNGGGAGGGSTGSAALPTGFVARANPEGLVIAAGAVAWTGSQFVALEQSTDYHNANAKFFVWTSPDGSSWTRSTTDMPSTYVQMSAANGKLFQLVGGAGVGSLATLVIYSSTDGLSWTSNTANYDPGAYAASPLSVKYLNGRYFASVDVNACVAISSTNASSWSTVNLKSLALPTNYTRDSNHNFCSEPFYLGGKYLVYGGVIKDYVTSNTNPPSKGLVYSSTDGVTWTANGFSLPAGANAIGQGGRVSNVIQIGNSIVIPAVMAQASRRINPSDPYPTLVTDSAQVGTSSDGLTFTYSDAVGLTYASFAVGKPGLAQYFTGLEVSGLGMLGYNSSNTTNYWSLDGVTYTEAQDLGLRSPTSAYSSRYAYSPTLGRLVVIQWTNTGVATPTIMTKDFR